MGRGTQRSFSVTLARRTAQRAPASWSDSSRVLRWTPMTAASEVPAAYRNAAATPGPIALLLEAAAEVLSRRRLVRYLVQAEIKKRGANTLLGNIWWVLDPLLLMAVYVVLVTIITRRA